MAEGPKGERIKYSVINQVSSREEAIQRLKADGNEYGLIHDEHGRHIGDVKLSDLLYDEAHFKLKKIMLTSFTSIPTNMTLTDAIALMKLEKNKYGVIINKDCNCGSIVTIDILNKVIKLNNGNKLLRIRDIPKRADGEDWTPFYDIRNEDDDILDLVGKKDQNFIIKNKEKKATGIITEDLIRAYNLTSWIKGTFPHRKMTTPDKRGAEPPEIGSPGDPQTTEGSVICRICKLANPVQFYDRNDPPVCISGKHSLRW